jgi:hypothetical protein
LAQRSRKRGRRAAPSTGPGAVPGGAARGGAVPVPDENGPPEPAPAAGELTRSQRRDAAARAQLAPLGPDERPWPLLAGVALTGASGVANLAAWLAGADVAGKHPAAGGIIAFTVVMLACSIGMWRRWYGAVLAFMVLLAIIIVIFSLLFVEASNLLGFIVAPAIIAAAGFLFWKMVRVLGRIQVPAAQRRDRQSPSG